MYIKKTFKESGQEFCLVVNDIGEEFTWTKKTVKNSILDGIIQFENARLSPAGRLFPKSENDVRLKATLENQNPTGLPVGSSEIKKQR